MANWFTDPTIPDIVTVPCYHEGDIQLQVNSTFHQLQEDIQQSAFKDRYFHYFTMTINIGQSVSTGRGTADYRRILFKLILKNCIADLIFVQEIDSRKTLKGLCEEYPAYDYQNTGKEAGIMWNTTKFSDEKLGKDFDSVKQQHEQRNLEEESGIFSRLSVLLLTTKTSDGTDTSLVDEFSVANRSFLACSWHGSHIVKDEKKKKTSSEFQQIMTNFSTLKEVPFIVGGDFNLNTSKIEPQCGIKSPGYEKSLRSKQFAEKSQKFIEYKDNFMLSNTDMNIEWVRPIEFLKMKSNSDSDSETKPHDLSLEEHEKMEDLSKEFENIYDIFDHDPIMGILSLR